MFHKIGRMLRAKVGQVKDRGFLAVVGEAAMRRQLPWRRAPMCQEADDDFDAKYGTDTSGIVQPWDLDIPDSLVGQANHYGTARMGAFTQLLASLDIQHALYSFIDLGCGKGRALLLASRFPFKEIIGVELSHELQQTCRLNISRFRSDWQQCTNIVSLCQNATEFTFPAQNSVLYLFNPFGAETLCSVVANLEASIRWAPRRVYVIYVKPVHRRVFENGLWSLFSTIENNVIYVNHMPAIDPC
jgi:SAM-dependent methyltransferase